jgi:hypothetical protein
MIQAASSRGARESNIMTTSSLLEMRQWRKLKREFDMGTDLDADDCVLAT